LTLLIYIILALLSFLPIVIWAYSFSFIDNNPLNKRRFLVWVLGWILSVFPILYMEKIVNFFNFEYLNVFYFVHQIKDFFSSLEFSLSLSLFLLIMVLASFLLWWFFWKKLNLLKVYSRNILVFLFFAFILSIILFFVNFSLKWVDFSISNPVNFWNIIFDTFKLIIFYYLIVAFIEEAAKHFNFLQSSILYIKSVKDWVLYAIFVALGFSFIENLLYLQNYYEIYWISYELAKLYFFRSTFSIIVHILSSSVIAYYFSKALILYRSKDLSFSYLKIFCFGLIISILLHLIFDVFLSLWFIFVIFLYFIWGYLYVSSIFYKE
jgi:RsiW-degrading membrane proteinase PrsW (M82 family)